MIQQVRWVQLSPRGHFMGPMGKTKEFVEQAQIEGYRRTTRDPKMSDEDALTMIGRLGYSVVEVLVQHGC